MKTITLIVCLLFQAQISLAANHQQQSTNHAQEASMEKGLSSSADINSVETTNRKKPVYLIVQLTVPDTEAYTTRYAIPVVQQLRDVGAKLLAASPEPLVLEGKWDHKWTVIIEFPSMSVAKNWYSSEKYKPFRDIRVNEVTEGGNMVFVSGY